MSFSTIDVRTGDPTMTSREVAKYSIKSAIQQALPGARRGFEREISDAAVARVHRPAAGIVVPAEIFFGVDLPPVRGMSAGIPSAGGFTIGDQVRPLIDYVWGASGVLQLGAVMVGGLEDSDARGTIGSQALPAINSATEGEWVAEGVAPIGDFTPTVGQAIGTPKRIVATLPVSKQWLTQAGAGAEAIIRRHLMGAVAAGLDRTAAAGTGGVKPTGVLYKDGVTVVAMGNDGAAPTLGKLNDLEEGIIDNRLPLQAAGYIISKNVRDCLKRTAKATSTSTFLLETIAGRDYVNGFPAFATTFLPDDLTKGSGSSLGSILFGRFDYLEIYLWGGADIVVDPFTRKRENIVEITINLLADVVTGRAGAFARAVDVVTT